MSDAARMGILRRFLRDDRADSAIEYGLLAGLIACFVIGGIQKVGSGLNNKIKVISNALS